MQNPKKYLDCLLNQREEKEKSLADKNEEIREHINRYDLNKDKKEWPTKERIENIGRNRTLEDEGHYEQMTNLDIARDLSAGCNDIEPAQDNNPISELCDKISQHGNSYDLIIKGKYGSPPTIIDCYRLFAALDDVNLRPPAEIEHSIKKLLFAGNRGSKDSMKDYQEAANQMQMYFDRL